VTCRDEVLAAFDSLERWNDRTDFGLAEVVHEVQAAGTVYSENTIRTHITSRMCADAPDHHATVYDDLERIDRALYRRRSRS
jgi:hypothetical protein